MNEVHITRRGTVLRENSPSDLSAIGERLSDTIRDINYGIWENKP